LNAALSETSNTVERRASDDALALRIAMTALSPDDRELLWLTYWEDRSRTEVGKIIGLSQTNVRVRLSRIRRRLIPAIDHPASPKETDERM
jgi:RNA polymerase sigma factor (sigma-70 family)